VRAAARCGGARRRAVHGPHLRQVSAPERNPGRLPAGRRSFATLAGTMPCSARSPRCRSWSRSARSSAAATGARHGTEHTSRSPRCSMPVPWCPVPWHRYTTSLHAINSAILKLARLTFATKACRGTSTN
jgi:hypothetical protein